MQTVKSPIPGAGAGITLWHQNVDPMKSKILLFVFGLLAAGFAAQAQLTRQWLNSYVAEDSAYTNVIGLYDAGNGHVVKATMLNKYNPPQDAYNRLRLQRFSPAGSLVWQTVYDHPVYDVFNLYQGRRDAAGNLYFIGNLSISQSSTGWFVVSFDANGQFRWKKEIVENLFSEGNTHSIALDASANVYVGGYVSGALSYGVIVKYDSNGNELWNHKVVSEFNYANDLAVAANGDVLSATNTYITRLNAGGQEQWSLPDSGFYAYPTIVESVDGSIYTLMYEGYYYHLRKYSSTGSLLWVYDDFEEYLAFGDNSIQLLSDAQGNVYCAGINTTDTLYHTAVAKISPQGVQLWRQGFKGAAPEFYDVSTILVLPSGNVAASGTMTTNNAGTAILDGNTGAIIASDEVAISPNYVGGQHMVNNAGGLFVAGTGDRATHIFNYTGGALSLAEAQAEASWAVFPNPFSESVTIQAGFVIQRYEVYTLTGQCVLQGNPNGNTTLHTESLSAGTYLLKVWGDGNTTAIRKIIKK